MSNQDMTESGLGPLQPMSIETGSKFTASSSRQTLGLVNHVKKLDSRCGIMLIVLSTLALVAVFLGPAIFSASGTTATLNSRPSDLRGLVRDTWLNSLAMGSLSRQEISTPVIMNDHGVQVYLSYPLQARPKEKSSSSHDPLDPSSADPNLIVSAIPPQHTLLLNKFSTFKDHALLVTTQFEEQANLLTVSDLEAWFWCLNAARAVGFYNSDRNAGASQPHKHMQFIPLDVFAEIRGNRLHAVPIDDLIMPKFDSNEWIVFDPSSAKPTLHTYSLPQWKFIHGIVRIMDENAWTDRQLSTNSEHTYNEYLFTAYKYLLASLRMIQGDCFTDSSAAKDEMPSNKATACVSYNMIATTRWMMIVPRTKSVFGNGLVNINGFGFIGFMLARNESVMAPIRSAGPVTVLQGVTFPALA